MRTEVEELGYCDENIDQVIEKQCPCYLFIIKKSGKTFL